MTALGEYRRHLVGNNVVDEGDKCAGTRETRNRAARNPRGVYARAGSPRRKAALIFSGVMGWMLLHSPATLSRRRALCRAARPKGAPLGPGKRRLEWLHLSDLR